MTSGPARARLSARATRQLRSLTARTALSEGAILRLALRISLSDVRRPDVPDNEAGQEFDRYSIFGAQEPLYVLVLYERLLLDGLEFDQHYPDQLRAHLQRGLSVLQARVRRLEDVTSLFHPDRRDATA